MHWECRTVSKFFSMTRKSKKFWRFVFVFREIPLTLQVQFGGVFSKYVSVFACRALPESWSESARGEKEEIFRVWSAEAWRGRWRGGASEWTHLCSRRWRWRYDTAISEGPPAPRRYLHTAKQKLQSWTIDNEWKMNSKPTTPKSLTILYLTILAFSVNKVIAVPRWQVTWVKLESNTNKAALRPSISCSLRPAENYCRFPFLSRGCQNSNIHYAHVSNRAVNWSYRNSTVSGERP